MKESRGTAALSAKESPTTEHSLARAPAVGKKTWKQMMEATLQVTREPEKIFYALAIMGTKLFGTGNIDIDQTIATATGDRPTFTQGVLCFDSKEALKKTEYFEVSLSNKRLAILFYAGTEENRDETAWFGADVDDTSSSVMRGKLTWKEIKTHQ